MAQLLSAIHMFDHHNLICTQLTNPDVLPHNSPTILKVFRQIYRFQTSSKLSPTTLRKERRLTFLRGREIYKAELNLD